MSGGEKHLRHKAQLYLIDDSVSDAIRNKEDEHKGHIPIIAMTAHALKGDKDRFLVAGMIDYIEKPIRPEKMIAASAKNEDVSDLKGIFKFNRLGG